MVSDVLIPVEKDFANDKKQLDKSGKRYIQSSSFNVYGGAGLLHFQSIQIKEWGLCKGIGEFLRLEFLQTYEVPFRNYYKLSCQKGAW